jgi:hypothetical protein
MVPPYLQQLWPERRGAERFPAALPAILELGGKQLSARLVDLGVGGGRVEVAVIPLTYSDLRFRCGTIDVPATVLWNRCNEIGLRFQKMLTEAQVNEQVRRAQALASLQDARPGPAQPS